MVLKRDLLMKKNMLRKGLAEGKITQKAFELAIKKIDEEIQKEKVKKDEFNSNLTVFRKKFLSR